MPFHFDREAVEAAARIAITGEREEYQRQEREALERLRDAKVRMTQPDRRTFEEAAPEVWRRSADRIDRRLVATVVTAERPREERQT